MKIGEIDKSDFFIRLLSVFVFIGLLGALKPVLFNEGSPAAKYFAKQAQLEMVQEESVETYMESALFGDGNAELILNEKTASEHHLTKNIDTIFRVDFSIACILLLASLFILWLSLLRKVPLHHCLLLFSLWLFCQSIAVSLNGGKKFSELAVLAHATRWGLPLVLWMALSMIKKEQDFLNSKWLHGLLIFCASFTFAVHGWEAFQLNPPFQDLIYNFASVFGLEVSPSVNSAILKTVGCMDILLALFLLKFQNLKLILWMSFWGLVTALSRPLTIGLEAWPEAAMRIANFAVPFTYFLIIRSNREFQEKTESELETQKMEMVYE